MRHDADSLRATVAEQKRHSDLDVLGSDEEAEEAGAGFVGAKELAAEDSFDDGSLTDASDVDCVLEAFLDAFDAWVLDDHDGRLRMENFLLESCLLLKFKSSHLEEYAG